MNYEILLRNVSFKESSEYITKNAQEIYYVEPGYKIFDKRLIGTPPIPIGVGQDYIILTYVKPCYGSFVLKLPRDENEINKLKTAQLKQQKR